MKAKSWPTIRCPRCKQPMKVTTVWFVENFTVVIEGECCGKELTSGEMEILKLMPDVSKGEVTH